MKLPVQITFRNVDRSPALEQRIARKAAWLERYSPDVMSCHVMVEAPHRHQRKGRLVHVRIDLVVPGGELVTARAPGLHAAHEDPYVAVRDAFRAARRALMDHVRVRRQKVKRHTIMGRATAPGAGAAGRGGRRRSLRRRPGGAAA